MRMCRLQSALQGECSDECEDQLQHTISVHLRTRYLASELDQEEVATHVQVYEGSLDHKPAVYLHHKLRHCGHSIIKQDLVVLGLMYRCLLWRECRLSVFMCLLVPSIYSQVQRK